MEKLDDGLKALLDQGKEKGYLTYTQVNELLPDDAVNPEKLDQLLILLEEQGVELIDEDEAQDREVATPVRVETDSSIETRDLDINGIIEDEGDGKRID